MPPAQISPQINPQTLLTSTSKRVNKLRAGWISLLNTLQNHQRGPSHQHSPKPKLYDNSNHTNSSNNTNNQGNDQCSSSNSSTKRSSSSSSSSMTLMSPPTKPQYPHSLPPAQPCLETSVRETVRKRLAGENLQQKGHAILGASLRHP